MNTLSYVVSVMAIVVAIGVFTELTAESSGLACPFSEADAVAKVVSDPYFIKCVCYGDAETALAMLRSASLRVSGVCLNNVCAGFLDSVVAVVYVPVCNVTVTVYVD